MHRANLNFLQAEGLVPILYTEVQKAHDGVHCRLEYLISESAV